jgi:DNA-binding response OmpR family regulator
VSQKILVVEDHKKTAKLIRMYLESSQYDVLEALNGRQAIDLARQTNPDLIILDLMLPKVDGLDVCRILRAESKTPIIMLTAKTTEDDILLGLDLGADDYMTKPFSPRELVARVRTVLRRISEESALAQPIRRFGNLTIDSVRHEVRLGIEIVHLTPKEFRLLDILSSEPRRAFARHELVERAFGYSYEGLERAIDSHIMNLRKKVEQDSEAPVYIQTVFGVGYRFAVDPDVS